MKCCEKGSRGKTRIRRESVARRGQCCEKGVLRKGRPPVYIDIYMSYLPISCSSRDQAAGDQWQDTLLS